MVNIRIIRKVINDTDYYPGKVFAIAVQVLIVISLVTFSISTIPDLSPVMMKALDTVEVISVLIFTIEYILRLVVAEKKN